MESFKTTKLTAAKICHEIANYLSVMKFLQEDLKGSNVYEIKELFNYVDLLTYTLDFFRNIYSASGNISNLPNVIFDICKSKKIDITPGDIFSKFSNPNETNIICGILYIIIKCCKSGDVISISSSNNSLSICVKNKGRVLPLSIASAINNEENVEDIFNIFILYIKQLAKDSGYNMFSDLDENEFLRVKIWKK